MALVKCPECGTEVSSEAYKCPKCGKALRKLKRGIFGKLCLWSFYGWNIICVLWIVFGLQAVSEGPQPTNDAEAVGAAIGAGLGVTMILILWVIGDIITGLLALLTRPKAP